MKVRRLIRALYNIKQKTAKTSIIAANGAQGSSPNIIKLQI